MPRDAAPVSVIIPAFNAAKSIERALRSVALQTLPPSEVIVVDDGSSDDTTAVAKAMQDEFHETQFVVISQPNKGAGAARNRAVEAATELYVAFLDADDEWLPNKLERSMDVLASKNYTLVAHDYMDVTPSGEIHVDCAQRFNEGPDPYTSLYLKGYIPSISVVARKEAVLAAGGFDETLRNAQDFDLWLNILADPVTTFTVFGEPLARYYHTPGGIMSHTERRITCCVQIAYRYFPALRARHENAVSILIRRLVNVYCEALAVYLGSGKYVRATAMPFRLANAAIKAGLNPEPTSNHNGTIPFVVYSVWVIAILGLYLSQFQHLIDPLMNVLRKAVGLE